ncbi:MAG: GAF domain-containing protein [Tissierellia bacterium]|nr:GAF domain-containing protein [Tissierellia bacterium]
MFKLDPIKKMNEEERLKYMNMLLKSQLSSEQDDLANLSNASAIIMACVERLNWAGFYILRGDELVLGPFQGLPACNRIEIGKGVCGTAVKTRQVQLVPDVHQFPGHIACDEASNSELVIPIIKDDKVYGVLDLDSPEKGRFTELEKEYFIKFVDILNEYIDWNNV